MMKVAARTILYPAVAGVASGGSLVADGDASDASAGVPLTPQAASARKARASITQRSFCILSLLF